MLSIIIKSFKTLFGCDYVLQMARETKAIKRLRDVHPLDFCVALIASASGDEYRSIATARRKFQKISHVFLEESSFYQHFNDGMVKLLRQLFSQALNMIPEMQHSALVEALGGKGIVDLLVMDASQVLLNKKAAAVLPSTSEEHGGFKLTVTMSLMLQTIQRVVVSAARPHDSQFVKLDRWMHGQLMLFDRGYFAYDFFQQIIERKGFFVSRFKTNSRPVISAIRSGLGKTHLGQKWSLDLPFRGLVDLDVEAKTKSGETVKLRLVRTHVASMRQDNNDVPVDAWLVTNLSFEKFSANDIGVLYRMRWAIEILFRQLKTVGRLDQLNSEKMPVIMSFLYATLIAALLSREICAQMRKNRPTHEPSEQRVMQMLVANLPELVAALPTKSTRCKRRVFEYFEQALWREGLNPNPGRKNMTIHYAELIK